MNKSKPGTLSCILRMVAFVTVLVAPMFLGVLAHSREGWQGRPLVCDPEVMGRGLEFQKCQAWISRVKRPDNPPEYPDRTCCGEADAYVADGIASHGGKHYAVITEDYPATEADDGEGGKSTVKGLPKGTEIFIPDEKLNRAFEQGGNPSGHGVVFINTSGEVLCYFAPSLW